MSAIFVAELFFSVMIRRIGGESSKGFSGGEAPSLPAP